LNPHLFVDDTQIYGYGAPADAAALQDRMSACMDAVSDWMRFTRLQLQQKPTLFGFRQFGASICFRPTLFA
jgi:hypothetical protein